MSRRTKSQWGILICYRTIENLSTLTSIECSSIFGMPLATPRSTTWLTSSSQMPVLECSATLSIIRSRSTSSASGTSIWKASRERCSLSSLGAKVIWHRAELFQQSSRKTSKRTCPTASSRLKLQLMRTFTQLISSSPRSAVKSSKEDTTLRNERQIHLKSPQKASASSQFHTYNLSFLPT